MKLLLRWLFTSLTLVIIAGVIPGFTISSFYIALIVAIILGILNVLVKPILVLLTLPINLLTLGLFTFVINAALLFFVASFVDGFDATFAASFFASILMWIVSLLTQVLLRD